MSLIFEYFTRIDGLDVEKENLWCTKSERGDAGCQEQKASGKSSGVEFFSFQFLTRNENPKKEKSSS